MSGVSRAKAALETLSTVLVVVAASAMIWVTFFKGPAQSSVEAQTVQDVTGVIEKTRLTNILGQGDIAIIEFSDFQCPFCAQHAQQTLPILKRDILDSGKARYVVLDLPLAIHPYAVPAAEAAECAAEQGKYWEMHDRLFERQRELATADFVAYAADLDLDTSEFAVCLKADTALQRVKGDEGEARRLGVAATPTLFVGRMRPDGGVDLLRRISGAPAVNVLLDEVSKLTEGLEER